MDFSRYEKLRTLVRANFSEQTQALVDEALVYADGKLASLTRYDGSPLLTHAAAVAGIVISEVGLGRNSTISAILPDQLDHVLIYIFRCNLFHILYFFTNYRFQVAGITQSKIITFSPASLFPTFPWHSLLPRYIVVPVANVNYALARFLPSG